MKWRYTQHDAPDLNGSKCNGSHDHDVEKYPEIEGPETAKESCGLTSVTQLVKSCGEFESLDDVRYGLNSDEVR